jgi:nicotinamide-nucleotide amidase
MPRSRTPVRTPSVARPTARILSVGDELILGRVVDTNATFLCRLLTDHGFRVLGARQAGDDQAGLVAALEQSCADADLVLVSGGLGPTDDDRTRHALAEVMGVELREHAPSWAAIERRYRQVAPGREIPVNNRRQALVPRGAKTLANDRGTAPGLQARHGATVIAVFPGVPHEMKAMAERFAASFQRHFPALAAPAVGEIFFSGIGESAAQQRLGDLLTESAPQVGITVNEAGHLTLRVVGTARAVAARVRALRAPLREYLLPAAGLAPSLVARLTAKRQTIAVAESCSGGHLAAFITGVPGASAVLHEGLVAYHADVKQRELGVSQEIIAGGVVSEACVRAMAEGMRMRSGATLALATTGIAGPAGGTPDQPVGTVWVGAATRAGTVARCVRIQGTRERIQVRAAATAMLLGWEVLCGKVALG